MGRMIIGRLSRVQNNAVPVISDILRRLSIPVSSAYAKRLFATLTYKTGEIPFLMSLNWNGIILITRNH